MYVECDLFRRREISGQRDQTNEGSASAVTLPVTERFLRTCTEICDTITSGIFFRRCWIHEFIFFSWISVYTWLREISSRSSLTFLPGPAWVLLSKICQDFFSALYNVFQLSPMPRPRAQNGSNKMIFSKRLPSTFYFPNSRDLSNFLSASTDYLCLQHRIKENPELSMSVD